MPRLVTCAGCRRHVRAFEVRCPFCGEAPARCVAPTPRRWALSASLLGLGAIGLVAGAVACDKKAAVPDATPEADAGDAAPDGPPKTSAAPSDDGPAPDDEDDGATPPDDGAALDDGAAVPQKTIYGGPRMMGAPDPEPPAEVTPEPAPEAQAEPARPDAPTKKIYGGPRREVDAP